MAGNLPQKLPLELMQTRWAAILQPVIDAPNAVPLILPNVSLATGTNTIKHRLGRKLSGWSLVRQRAAATLYDEQDSNPHPETTLILIASAPMVVDLLVF